LDEDQIMNVFKECEIPFEAAYNNVHRNTTLISPLTAGLLNVIKVAPEVIESKCF